MATVAAHRRAVELRSPPRVGKEPQAPAGCDMRQHLAVGSTVDLIADEHCHWCNCTGDITRA